MLGHNGVQSRGRTCPSSQRGPRPNGRHCEPRARAATAVTQESGQAGPRDAVNAVVQAAWGGGLYDPPFIMVNSCTGRMGHATAEAVVAAGLPLVPVTLTGSSRGVAVSNIGVAGVPVELVGKERRQEAMDAVKAQYPGLIVVDYTLPYCVEDNARFYAANGVPFVMGTTGGNQAALARAAREGGVMAVIAPQMGKQVVAFQAMMKTMADSFPGVFRGYNLQVVESHQRNKADTSGTAKAVVASFNGMGVEFNEADIRRVRDRATQVGEMGVPEDALEGHAFHTYRLTSPDGSVAFTFKHNVVQRRVYAEGSVDAVLFLARKLRWQSAAGGAAPPQVYDMVDVLREGALR